ASLGEGEEEIYRAMAAAHSVDGIIVHAPRADDRRIKLLNRLGMRFIVHGRSNSEHDYSWLDINNRRAFARATSYLIELGHRKIALLNGIESMQFARRRRLGYEAALAEAGIELDPALLFSADMTEPYGYHTTRQLLRNGKGPTALLASSLITALGISRAIADCGFIMGRDISVITHDDATSFLPNYGDVPLFTSTKSSVRAAGKRMAEMLIDLIEGRSRAPVTELWEAEMILGSSTGPAPESPV
ncbi:MAG: substrate-binding domain-containing protein, partial [Pseudomonadota bacterium]